jgi:hypothetical protein
MRNDPTLRLSPPHRSPTDGWLGTRELPGYRAGNVVAMLDDLPEVDPHHLYFDLLLLDASGRIQDNHSGPCYALAHQHSLDERSRFVRMVAELVRHAPGDAPSLAAIGQALTFIRERGVEFDRLIAAAQLLDDVCSERAVAESLNHVLELSMGEDEARRAMCDVVVGLARSSGVDSAVSDINDSGLAEQVSYVVRTVGKTRARHYLREVTDFEMVPKPDMFGV